MNQKQHRNLSATCQCGKVKFEAVGPPILTGSCYCMSCQEAGRQFEQLASAPPVLEPDSGTGVILYRKDRVQCTMGQEYLEERRLKPDSPTRRVVAMCCNSAMFLDFTKGHWLSIYRNRFPKGVPPLDMRVMTKERRIGVELADAARQLGMRLEIAASIEVALGSLARLAYEVPPRILITGSLYLAGHVLSANGTPPG